MILYHGTSDIGIDSILEHGFVQSVPISYADELKTLFSLVQKSEFPAKPDILNMLGQRIVGLQIYAGKGSVVPNRHLAWIWACELPGGEAYHDTLSTLKKIGNYLVDVSPHDSVYLRWQSLINSFGPRKPAVVALEVLETEIQKVGMCFHGRKNQKLHSIQAYKSARMDAWRSHAMQFGKDAESRKEFENQGWYKIPEYRVVKSLPPDRILSVKVSDAFFPV